MAICLSGGCLFAWDFLPLIDSLGSQCQPPPNSSAAQIATEAKATKARRVSCGGHGLVPVTSNDKPGQSGRTVKWWCAPCSGFRSWAVDEADYAGLLFCPDGIPRVPPSARETLRGAITADDFEYALGQLPNNRAPGPGVPFEFLRYAPRSMKETVRTCINSILTGEAPPPRSWMGGLIRFLLKKEDVLHISGYRPVCLLDTV
jgi:hypothetical protein